MARSSLQITIDQRTPLVINDSSPKGGRPLLRKLVRHLEGIMGGSVDASSVTIDVDGAQPIAASGTIILNNVSVSDTVTINGQALTAVASAPTANQFTQAGTDIVDATDLARCINASTTAAIVSSLVEASNFAGSVTLATCTAGTIIEIANHEFRAIAAANATSQGNQANFSIAGTDTADATALVVCINGHPVLSHQVVASSSAGVVTIRQRRGTAALGKILIKGAPGVAASGATATTQFVATATVLVSGQIEDQCGNAYTLAESTSAARITVSGARLTGGTGSASGTTVRILMGASGN